MHHEPIFPHDNVPYDRSSLELISQNEKRREYALYIEEKNLTYDGQFQRHSPFVFIWLVGRVCLWPKGKQENSMVHGTSAFIGKGLRLF
jgi:hypothetical protein